MASPVRPKSYVKGELPDEKRIREGRMDDIKSAIRQFILSTYLAGEAPETLRDDTPLLTSGILASLAALNLANFVNQEFGVELEFDETSPERFNRIQDIAESVARKRPLRPQPSEGGLR